MNMLIWICIRVRRSDAITDSTTSIDRKFAQLSLDSHRDDLRTVYIDATPPLRRINGPIPGIAQQLAPRWACEFSRPTCRFLPEIPCLRARRECRECARLFPGPVARRSAMHNRWHERIKREKRIQTRPAISRTIAHDSSRRCATCLRWISRRIRAALGEWHASCLSRSVRRNSREDAPEKLCKSSQGEAQSVYSPREMTAGINRAGLRARAKQRSSRINGACNASGNLKRLRLIYKARSWSRAPAPRNIFVLSRLVLNTLRKTLRDTTARRIPPSYFRRTTHFDPLLCHRSPGYPITLFPRDY